MVIQCTICSDLINPSENIFVTKCGHLFHFHCLQTWIAQSKSCPQCRQRVTDKCMFRVFLNVIDSTPTGDENVASLLMKLDHEKLKAGKLELEMKGLRDTNTRLNMDLESYLKDVKALKSRIINTDSLIAASREQMRYLQNENKELKKVQQELEVQRQNVQTLQGLQRLLNSTTEEAKLMLENYKDVRIVSIFAAALKKALDESEEEKNLLRNRLQMTKQELAEGKVKVVELQEKISTMTKDYESLNNKAYKASKEDTSHLDDSWCLNNSRVNTTRTKAKTTYFPSNTSLNTLVKKTENADSPYLNLKQSGLAWAGLLQPTTSKAALVKPTKKFLKPSATVVSGSLFNKQKEKTLLEFGYSTDDESIFKENTKRAWPELNADNATSKSERDISNNGLGGYAEFSDVYPKRRVYSNQHKEKNIVLRVGYNTDDESIFVDNNVPAFPELNANNLQSNNGLGGHSESSEEFLKRRTYRKLHKDKTVLNIDDSTDDESIFGANNVTALPKFNANNVKSKSETDISYDRVGKNSMCSDTITKRMMKINKFFSTSEDDLSIFGEKIVPALPEFNAVNAQSEFETDISYDGLGGHAKCSGAFRKCGTKPLKDRHRLKRPNTAGAQDIGKMFKKVRDQ